MVLWCLGDETAEDMRELIREVGRWKRRVEGHVRSLERSRLVHAPRKVMDD